MDFWQIFTLITGILYIVFEVRQKNAMWLVGILTSFAAMWVFFRQANYASFVLNGYYLIVSFIGFWRWQQTKSSFQAAHSVQAEPIVLKRLTLPSIFISALITFMGTFALSWLMTQLYQLGYLHENPFSLLDSFITLLSAVATWHLVQMHREQWYLWIIADTLTVVLCAMQALWWMSALYVAYVLAAIYGLHYWQKNGIYLNSNEKAA